MNEDLLIIQLRDCFTAGYTFPQFCIDNGIKKPLFVAVNERRADFLWEIYIQFKYDKRITPNFCLLDGKINKIDFSVQFFVNPLSIKKFSEINSDDYDQIILLSANKLDLENRNVIRFEYVLNFFMNRAYVENPLLKFAENHRGVKIIMMNYPLLFYVSNPSEREKELLKKGSVSRYRWEIEKDKSGKVPTTYDELGYTNQMVYELTEVVGAKINPDGSASLYDRESPIVGIRNGKRMVADQPETYTNRIFFFGNCVYYGHGVPYDRTVESYLQKFFNVNRLPYRVENESQPVNGRYQDLFYNLNKIQTKPGDIIFVGIHYMQSPIFPFIDTNQIFKRPHNHGEVFPDHSHVNELGHLALAKFFFQILVQNKFFRDVEFKYPAPPPRAASIRYSA